MRNVDIQFIVDESDFDEAIRALHKALVENGPEGDGRRDKKTDAKTVSEAA
jgi:aspartate kinase